MIKGWDEGLVGLCKGAKAKLVLPPAMGYGDSGAGADIPGGATLNFDVEVVAVLPGPTPAAPPNTFKKIDTDGDGKLSVAEVEAFFKEQGAAQVPETLWAREDEDKDGFISWEEFTGPKGTKDEL